LAKLLVLKINLLKLRDHRIERVANTTTCHRFITIQTEKEKIKKKTIS